MAKFKVGDKVKVVDDNGGGKIGDIATVTKVNAHDGNDVFYELDGLSHGSTGLYEYRLELAPKFKVGDRVAYNDDTVSGVGTVAVVGEDDGDSFHDYTVNVEPKDSYFAYYPEGVGRRFRTKHLRLVAPATSGKRETLGDILAAALRRKPKTAIVALIENGQPKPATRPFVHPDREAAAKEARRLAGKHKGREFGVYELVDTAREAKVYEHEWQRLTMDGKTWRAAKMLAAESGLEYEQARDAVFGWFAKQAA